jgi:hypothetical protein
MRSMVMGSAAAKASTAPCRLAKVSSSASRESIAAIGLWSIDGRGQADRSRHSPRPSSPEGARVTFLCPLPCRSLMRGRFGQPRPSRAKLREEPVAAMEAEHIRAEHCRLDRGLRGWLLAVSSAARGRQMIRIVASLTAALIAGSAMAADIKVLHRDGLLGPTIILIEGMIGPGDAEKFREAVTPNPPYGTPAQQGWIGGRDIPWCRWQAVSNRSEKFRGARVGVPRLRSSSLPFGVLGPNVPEGWKAGVPAWRNWSFGYRVLPWRSS